MIKVIFLSDSKKSIFMGKSFNSLVLTHISVMMIDIQTRLRAHLILDST